MTCNPQCPEIKENLGKYGHASYRPDLVATVFMGKVKHLIWLLIQARYFGEALAYLYAIEFQKRGLPHVHLILWLAMGQAFLTQEAIDAVITAEFPQGDSAEDEELRQLMVQLVVHNKCENDPRAK